MIIILSLNTAFKKKANLKRLLTVFIKRGYKDLEYNFLAGFSVQDTSEDQRRIFSERDSTPASVSY